MSVLKRIKGRRFFAVHFALLVFTMALFTWIDIIMIAGHLIVRDEGGEILGLHPYHFYIMTVTYTFIVVTISLTYALYTKDAVGTAALAFSGFIFSVFALEDILWFKWQGRELPQSWPWLWKSRASGEAMSGAEVVMWFNAGCLLIGLLVLTYFVYGKKIRKVTVR